MFNQVQKESWLTLTETQDSNLNALFQNQMPEATRNELSVRYWKKQVWKRIDFNLQKKLKILAKEEYQKDKTTKKYKTVRRTCAKDIEKMSSEIDWRAKIEIWSEKLLRGKGISKTI